jgi:hypothetical protein
VFVIDDKCGKATLRIPFLDLLYHLGSFLPHEIIHIDIVIGDTKGIEKILCFFAPSASAEGIETSHYRNVSIQG